MCGDDGFEDCLALVVVAPATIWQRLHRVRCFDLSPYAGKRCRRTDAWVYPRMRGNDADTLIHGSIPVRRGMSSSPVVQIDCIRFAVVLNVLVSSFAYRFPFFPCRPSSSTRLHDGNDNRNTFSSRLRQCPARRSQEHHTVPVSTMPADASYQQVVEPGWVENFDCSLNCSVGSFHACVSSGPVAPEACQAAAGSVQYRVWRQPFRQPVEINRFARSSRLLHAVAVRSEFRQRLEHERVEFRAFLVCSARRCLEFPGQPADGSRTQVEADSLAGPPFPGHRLALHRVGSQHGKVIRQGVVTCPSGKVFGIASRVGVQITGCASRWNEQAKWPQCSRAQGFIQQVVERPAFIEIEEAAATSDPPAFVRP